MNWNNYPAAKKTHIYPIYSRHDTIDFKQFKNSLLAYGNGKSYGDCCLNDHNTVLQTRSLNHFIHFDAVTGILTCEAGVTLAEISHVVIPQGWFLPVLPGTEYVTVGGAIANDVHGKNHYSAGSFGHHIIECELWRSDGCHYMCSEKNNANLFYATIGGLGLTGLIVSATLQLKKITHAFLDVSIHKFYSLNEFSNINSSLRTHKEYTVAWLDPYNECGHYMSANHNADKSATLKMNQTNRQINLPFFGHPILFNPWFIKIFNQLYFNKFKQQHISHLQHYRKFFFPLDGIKNWSHLYGKQGFLQYQCVLPHVDHVKAFLTLVRQSPRKTTLAVIKNFGSLPPLGHLSFPKPGFTIAMDFANPDQTLLKQLNLFDDMVIEAEGRINPGKDARMSSASFKNTFSNWQKFIPYVDKQFSSNFWRRIMETS